MALKNEEAAFDMTGVRSGTSCESFNGKLRDECLNQEILHSLKEAQIVIEQWRNQYNTTRPHSSLRYRPPAPQTSTGQSITLDRYAPIQ
jgi:hypothetical protein